MNTPLVEEISNDPFLQSVAPNLPIGHSVLLIGSDDLSIAKIVRTLHGISRSISIFRSVPAATLHLRRRPVHVLIFIPEDHRTWKSAVAPIDEVLTQVSAKPHKFCLMRAPYQGPAQRLDGDRIGWKVLYE